MLNRSFFAYGARTVFCKSIQGQFAEIRPDDLLVNLINHSILKSGKFSAPEDLIVGTAYPEGEQGYNLGRMIAIGLGLESPGCTVNRLCASSLEATSIASAKVGAGLGDCFLVAGVESMSRIPRRGSNFSPSDLITNKNQHSYIPNGKTAENVARKYSSISRVYQEEFVARSHELADIAFKNGSYNKQIVSIGKHSGRDEFIRVPVDREKMASLQPVFESDGVVTAATSSPLSDGAACALVFSEEVAREMGCKSAIEICDVAVSHIAPELMGLGPVPATKKLFERNNISVSNLAAVEINEAFAIQVLACIEELKIPLEIVNTWGGALALGHPLGASGLRLLMTLHDRLDEINEPGSLGLATLCVGGGQGMSVLVKHTVFD